MARSRALAGLLLLLAGCSVTGPTERVVETASIPVTIGGVAPRRMAYLWNGDGLLLVAKGGLWSSVSGDGIAYLPAGPKAVRIWTFAATDRNSCYEGDLYVSDQYGTPFVLRSPHKETKLVDYDAWQQQEIDPYEGPIRVRWVCRTTCADIVRCHYGVQIELEG